MYICHVRLYSCNYMCTKIGETSREKRCESPSKAMDARKIPQCAALTLVDRFLPLAWLAASSQLGSLPVHMFLDVAQPPTHTLPRVPPILDYSLEHVPHAPGDLAELVLVLIHGLVEHLPCTQVTGECVRLEHEGQLKVVPQGFPS